VNLITDLVNENEFIGVVILPVSFLYYFSNSNRKNSTFLKIRERPFGHKVDNLLNFINYTIHRQTLCHVNPLCLELKLLPGKYMIALITQAEVLPKRFSLRLATNTPNAAIMRLQ
jgi:hypothetical protein